MLHSGASSPSSPPETPRPKTSRPNASRKMAIESTARKSERSSYTGLPLPLKRLVRSLSKTNSKTNSRRKNSGGSHHQSNRQSKAAASNHPCKVLWAGGSVATLALLAIVPARVGSQAIASSSCQEVIKSGAEISRGELSRLLSIPEGASQEAVRQVIDAPYCLLPVAGSQPDAKQTDAKQTDGESVEKAATREAYPLAFDPEAWVVVSYEADEYAGYDFVFKP